MVNFMIFFCCWGGAVYSFYDAYLLLRIAKRKQLFLKKNSSVAKFENFYIKITLKDVYFGPLLNKGKYGIIFAISLLGIVFSFFVGILPFFIME